MAQLLPPDRVLETSTTTGTGSYQLLGAVVGYRAASAVATNADTVYYYAEDVGMNGTPLGSWETGLGTWKSGNILERTTIHASSNANTAVNWGTGTRRIGLSANNASFTSLEAQASAAATSETNAATSATTSSEWATKTTGIVASAEYSSKAYAVGGTGVTSTLGAAKEWAITVGTSVIAGMYSAKEWAVGTFIRGTIGGGSSKDWATYTAGTVDDAGYSAKQWATKATTTVDGTNYSAFQYAANASSSASAASTSETNAAASASSAVNAPGTSANSTTSLTIGTGSKSLTIQTGKAYSVGQHVVIAKTSAVGNYMFGQITAHDSGTGALTVNASTFEGSGTHTDWTISVEGSPGPTGLTGVIGGTEAQGATVNDYVVTVSPALTAYTTGTVIATIATHTNTGAATLQISALAAKILKDVDGNALASGDITIGSVFSAYYDGTDFFLISGNDRIARSGDTYTGTHDYTNATITSPQLDLKAPLASPALTGTPTTPTATAGTDTTQIASTAFVKTAVDTAVAGLLDYRGAFTPAVSSGATGYPTTGGSGIAGAILKGDTFAASASGFVLTEAIQVGDLIVAKQDTPAQVADNWDRLNTNISYVPEDTANKVTVFSTPTDTQFPSAKLVDDQLALKAPLASPALTGSPTAPTATVGTNTTQLATTAFVRANPLGGTVDANIAGADFTLSAMMLKDMGCVFLDKGNSGTATQTLDYTAGSHQKITATGNHTIATSNWPPTGNLGEILLELVNGGAFTITWPTINWIKPDGTVTTSISTYLAANTGRTALQSAGTDFIFIWSRDAGTTIYAKLV